MGAGRNIKSYDMKSNHKLYILVVLICLINLTACTSPEKRGKELGITFCKYLCNTNGFKYSYLLAIKRDSSNKIIRPEWEKAKADYNTDAAKWRVFTQSYENATQNTLEGLNANLSRLITSEIAGKLWAKEQEKNKNFSACSFDNGTLNLLNCKGEYSYKLYGDSIVFSDNKNTSGKISLTKEGKLILSVAGFKTKGQFHLAEDKDRLIGTWYAANGNGLVIAFNPGGEADFGGSGYYNVTSSYSLKDDILYVPGVSTHGMKMQNDDSFYWGEASFWRIRSSRVNDLTPLFVSN